MDRTKPKKTNKEKQLQFITAVKEKKADVVQKCMYDRCININEAFEGMNALDMVIHERDIAMVKVLLQHPDIKTNRSNPLQELPLYRALWRSQMYPLHLTEEDNKTSTKLLCLLLYHRGTDLNELDDHGGNFFIYACARGKLDIVELLLSDPFMKRGVSTQLKDNHLNTASHDACSQGHVPIVRLLVERGCFHATEHNRQGYQPFHVACEFGELNTVRYILNNFEKVYGLDIDTAANQLIIFGGIHPALDGGHLEVIEDILKYLKVKTIDLYYWLHLLGKVSRTPKGAQTKGLIMDTYAQVTNPLCYLIVSELLRCHFWSLFSEVTRSTYWLWKKTFSMTWACRQLLIHHGHKFIACPTIVHRLREDYHEQLFQEIMNNFKHAKTLLKTNDNNSDELHLLHHAVKYGLVDIVQIIVARNLKSSTSELIKGISLSNLAMKNTEIKTLIVPLENDVGNRKVCNQTENNAFAEWYHMLKWTSSSCRPCLKSIYYTPCSRLDRFILLLFLNKILLTTVIGTFLSIRQLMNINNESEEKQLVFKTMRSFMMALNAEVCKINPLHQFDAVQVGSSVENTRPYRPDEFDYLLVCRAILKFLEITIDEDSTSRVVIRLNSKAKKAIHKELETKDGYFNFELYTAMQMENIMTALNVLFADGPYEKYLWLEPQYLQPNFISCIHLRWRGIVYKDMEISVDMVPALELKNYTPHPRLVDEPCTYYAFTKEKHFNKHSERILWPVAFSEAEVKLIQKLPPTAHQGYKLAKALRIAPFFPEAIKMALQGVYAFDDCLKTYMLKTSVLVLSKVIPLAEQERFTLEQWTFMIYCYLVYRIRDNGSLLNIFDTEHHHRTFSIFACRHELDIAENDARACCIQRKNLLTIALYMLHVLRVFLELRGEFVPQLTKYPKVVSLGHPGQWFLVDDPQLADRVEFLTSYPV